MLVHFYDNFKWLRINSLDVMHKKMQDDSKKRDKKLTTNNQPLETSTASSDDDDIHLPTGNDFNQLFY